MLCAACNTHDWHTSPPLSACWISLGLGCRIAIALCKALMASAFFIRSRASQPTLRQKKQIDSNRQIELAPRGPGIPDIRTPFLIRSLTAEVLIAHVGSPGSPWDCLAGAYSAFSGGRCDHLHALPALLGSNPPQYPPRLAQYAYGGCAICSARQRKRVANVRENTHVI